jgi:ABC-2 type transport system ATP-binding protein
MIRTENLGKVFAGKKKSPPVVAVKDLNIDVAEGEVFGFLGPNGAGKTSLMGPSEGKAWVCGYEVGKNDQLIRSQVGILTETPGMYDRLSAEYNLMFYAKLNQVPDPAGQVEKYLRMLGLWDRRLDEVGNFSKGMRQKLAIARALLHEPRLLFLDEPTSSRSSSWRGVRSSSAPIIWMRLTGSANALPFLKPRSSPRIPLRTCASDCTAGLRSFISRKCSQPGRKR